MNKKTIRCLALFLVLFATVVCSAFPAGALSQEIPYESYTYWEDIDENSRKAVYNRPMYEVKTVLDSTALGVKPFAKLNDVTTGTDGYIYLLDDTSRIVIIDSNYKLVREIGVIVSGSEEYDYSGANSLYIHSDNTIYICDTENARVLHCDGFGKLIDVQTLPESSLIPEDYDYRPLHAVVDKRDYLYVLSDGSYYGMILYAPDRSFLGFYGANEVTTGIVGAVKNIWNRVFVSNTRKGNSARTLPYVFVDVVVGGDGFVYTATGFTDKSNNRGQIKKLSPGTGKNILGSEDINFTDDEINTTYKDGEELQQNIVGLAVDENGFIYCLDAAFGRVFLYDSENHMLSAFGSGMGAGTQKGSFTVASAIALSGSDVLVSDSTKCTVTVFSETKYGKLLKELQSLTIDGEYLLAKDGWQQVLEMDRSCQLAYSGLARAYLTENNYEAALEYSKMGYDRDTYALAFEFVRQNFINRNFWFIFIGILIMLCGLVAVIIIGKRRKITLIKNQELKLFFNTLIHPALSFEEVKEKGRGRIWICLITVTVYYIFSVLRVLCGGFLFTYYDPENFNSLMVLVRSVGFVVLWIVCNWMVCTLLGGRGKLREITVVTCYSLQPLIIEGILSLALTNTLLPSEGEFLGILNAVAILYALLLLVIGMIKIHDFSMSHFVGTSVLSVLGMAAVIFLIVMVGMLLQQLGGFIGTVFMEFTL